MGQLSGTQSLAVYVDLERKDILKRGQVTLYVYGCMYALVYTCLHLT